MNFQNEMNRKLSSKEKLGNGITWECLAKMAQETGQQVVGFKKKEGLNPCFNGHEEEIAQYIKVLWNTQDKLQEKGMPMKKRD